MLKKTLKLSKKLLFVLTVTVWCSFWAQGVIGLYFFEDVFENRITVNDEQYKNIPMESLLVEQLFYSDNSFLDALFQ